MYLDKDTTVELHEALQFMSITFTLQIVGHQNDHALALGLSNRLVLDVLCYPEIWKFPISTVRHACLDIIT